MTKDELIRMIRDNDFLPDGDMIDNCIYLFASDAEEACGLLEYYYRFAHKCFLVQGSSNHNGVHYCTEKYILRAEGNTTLRAKYLVMLYSLEIEYYAEMGACHECLRYVDRVLDMDISGHEEYIGSVLNMILSIFLESGICSETGRYIEALKKLADFSGNGSDVCAMYCGTLMEVYAVLGNEEECLHYSGRLDTYLKGKANPQLKLVIPLYQMGCRILLDKGKPADESFIKDFCRGMDRLVRRQEVKDDFSYALLPVFRVLHTSLTVRRLLKYVEYLIEHSNSLSDRIKFYEFLTDECGLDLTRYPRLRKGYLECLKKYHRDSREHVRQALLNELALNELERTYARGALFDTLTGVGSRNAYNNEMAGYKAKDGQHLNSTKFAIVLVDVNGLKETNDLFGDNAGDRLLTDAAEILETGFGDSGRIYRVTGDEFCVITELDREQIEQKVKLVRSGLDERNEKEKLKLSLSIGYTCISEQPGMTIDELIICAGHRKYEDKVRFYSQEEHDRRGRRT